MKLRKTRIRIETHRAVAVRRWRVVRLWCGKCGEDSEFVPVEGLNGLLEEGASAPAAKLSAPNSTSPKRGPERWLWVSSRCQCHREFSCRQHGNV